jgi:CspA family cold shock protein
MESVIGKIKWFDAAKGFGFVVSDSGGPDILLHGNVLKDFGQSSVVEETRIEIEVVATKRGSQASRILSITPPIVDTDEAHRKAAAFCGDVAKEAYEVNLAPARVKWFDKIRGFGCINLFNDNEDVFVHIEVLRAYGLAELECGEAIGVKTAVGERGKMAIEIRPWDYAIPK